MKKTSKNGKTLKLDNKKLTLRAEVLRKIETTELQAVAGGRALPETIVGV